MTSDLRNSGVTHGSIMHRKKSELPFEPFVRVEGQVDALELIGRRDPEDGPYGSSDS